MRSLVCLHAALSLIVGGSASCFAQQPGPATLEGLLNSDEAQKPAAAAEADAGPKRPAGTVTRPKDGVQHPDLDKAWADYDATVTKAAEGIRASINKQFDAAAARGDLDEAEKWQAALEKFEQTGEVPTDKEAKTAVSTAVADYKKARDELSKAYEAVVKSLTMDKNIADAKAVRGELAGFALTAPLNGMPRSTRSKWVLIFLGDDPSGWGKSAKAESTGIVAPEDIPADIKFLKFSRSPEEFVILEVTARELFGVKEPRKKWGWNGANRFEWGGHHLGVFGPPTKQNSREIAVALYPDRGGFGFGHPAGSGGQGYAWAGRMLDRTVFRIEVTADELSPNETKALLE